MEFNLPEDPSVQDRLAVFNKFLDDKFKRADTLVKESEDAQSRLLVKTERAEIVTILKEFRTLFEQELSG